MSTVTAAEKAKFVVNRIYQPLGYLSCNASSGKMWEYSKERAIEFVDEILLMFTGLHKPEYCSFDIYEPKQYSMEGETEFNGYTMSEYWEQVKTEINKL